MPAIDFPTFPTDNQTFTAGSKTWRYSSANKQWIASNLIETLVTSDKLATNAVLQPKMAVNVTATGPIFRAYTTVYRDIPDATYTKLVFDAISFNIGTPSLPYDTTLNRFVVPVSGVYLVLSKVCFISNGQTIGARVVSLFKNGVEVTRMSQVNPANFGILDVSYENGYALEYFTAGDYLELYLYMDTISGGSARVINGASFSGVLLHQL